MLRVFLWLLGIVMLLCLTPVFGVLAVSAVANAGHCQVDEGSVHPCMIAGHDVGSALYTFGVLGWLMLLTLPIFAVVIVVWLVLLIVAVVRRLRKV